MKAINTSVLLLCLIGCAVKPVEITGTFYADVSVYDAVKIIERNAKFCWERNLTWTHDSFVANTIESSFSTIITLTRWAPDIKNEKPFLRVSIAAVDDGLTRVEVSEGSCALDCDMNFSPDVKRWLQGDESC